VASNQQDSHYTVVETSGHNPALVGIRVWHGVCAGTIANELPRIELLVPNEVPELSLTILAKSQSGID
jgi:hypothetical protein